MQIRSLKHSQKGFSLVELSIVLMVIGLLFGGIMKASAMIENAQIQRDIKSLQSFQTAFMLYKDRHGFIPGEDPDKPGRLLTMLSTSNNPTQGLFYDLHHAGFTQLNPLPEIGAAFKSTWGGSSGDNYGLIAQHNQICITEIDTDLAQSIERKLDDNNAAQGDLEYALSGSQLCMRLR